MHQRRGIPTSIHRLFLVLIITTIIMVICTELYNTKYDPSPPPYSLQKTYISAECADRRLGNAMFIYATVVSVAKHLNASLAMQSDCIVTKRFNISASIVSNIRNYLPILETYEEFGHRASAYDPKLMRISRQNTLLKGYFQSWRYFKDAEADIKREFNFLKPTRELVKKFLLHNRPDTWIEGEFLRIGIHVRRGDLLLDHYKNYGYTTPDPAYYQHAMDYFKKRFSKVQFIVCSDDIDWAKDNIADTYLVYSENHKDYEDMAILSECDHMIISVGSFGWWAAWLANGTTLYYEKWPKEYSKLEYHVQKKTYFPPSWIPKQ